MMRKIFSLLVAGIFLISSMGMVFAETPSTYEAKLAAVETTLYGQTQTGALLDRIQKIEKEYGGAKASNGIMEQVDYLYNYTFDNSSAPSLVTQMNALEWTITHKVSMDSMQNRVTSMENLINGKPSEGTLHSRIEALAELTFGSKVIPLTQVAVPANTLAKVALVTPLNAKNLKAGDIIKYQAAEDVVENNMMLFAQGAEGEGVVNKVSQSGNFGRNAKIEADFKTLTAVDGTVVDMTLGQESKDRMEHMAMAAGASIAGMAILGPIGIIGGAFVHGKNIDLPAGTEFYIQTSKDTTVYAIPVTNAQ